MAEVTTNIRILRAWNATKMLPLWPWHKDFRRVEPETQLYLSACLACSAIDCSLIAVFVRTRVFAIDWRHGSNESFDENPTRRPAGILQMPRFVSFGQRCHDLMGETNFAATQWHRYIMPCSLDKYLHTRSTIFHRTKESSLVFSHFLKHWK